MIGTINQTILSFKPRVLLCKIYLAIFLCFASLFAHLSSILNNFNCNDENWIIGRNHKFTDTIPSIYIWGEQQLQKGPVNKIHVHSK